MAEKLAYPAFVDKRTQLFGFVCLQSPIVEIGLDIEDVDLLNTVAHHVSLALISKGSRYAFAAGAAIQGPEPDDGIPGA